MIRILHIETATKACSVAISFNGELVVVKESVPREYSHSENLTLYVQDVLQEAGIKLNDLSAVSVASGPGSYTGLRIGVSTAKGFCYALNIPLISVDALQSLAEIAREKHPNLNLCALIDARRMEVYSAIYNRHLDVIKPISADVIEDNSYTEMEPLVYFGDGAEKLNEIWKDRNAIPDLSIHSSAIGQVKPAYKKFQNADFEDLAYFEPYYLKDFIAK